jgi:hypothetical protein
MILGFSPEFNQAIKEGWKRQTIRKWNEKRRFYPGMELQFYNHVRQKNMKQFGKASVYKKVKFYWTLDNNGHIQGYAFRSEAEGYEAMTFDQFARADGFEDWKEMKAWFEARYSKEELEKPFQIINWGNSFEAV